MENPEHPWRCTTSFPPPKNFSLFVNLSVSANTLGEAIVLGKDKNRTAATFRFSSNRLGTEIGAMITTKKDSILVKSLNFNNFYKHASLANWREHRKKYFGLNANLAFYIEGFER